MWYYNIFQSQLFRHGLRTPLWLYNNTPCSTDTYSDGLGALTNDGIKSSYFLGKALRNRYTLSHPFSLLSQSYKPDEVYSKDILYRYMPCRPASIVVFSLVWL
uniref:Lysosomal acid phosphatase (Trinotate prediction) n=1 Tax=Henneguya salminicola TaxID=69463 RepID=A0A6G3ML48_HENSL